jgi:hypothetical protein
LGELPRMRPDASETDQRYRDVPAIDDNVLAGERGAPEQAEARLGCEEVDDAAVGGSEVLDAGVSEAVEAGGVRGGGW